MRRFLWIVWHTRPGHHPCGVVAVYGDLYCAACGARVPS